MNFVNTVRQALSTQDDESTTTLLKKLDEQKRKALTVCKKHAEKMSSLEKLSRPKTTN